MRNKIRIRNTDRFHNIPQPNKHPTIPKPNKHRTDSIPPHQIKEQPNISNKVISTC